MIMINTRELNHRIKTNKIHLCLEKLCWPSKSEYNILLYLGI